MGAGRRQWKGQMHSHEHPGSRPAPLAMLTAPALATVTGTQEEQLQDMCWGRGYVSSPSFVLPSWDTDHCPWPGLPVPQSRAAQLLASRGCKPAALPHCTVTWAP